MKQNHKRTGIIVTVLITAIVLIYFLAAILIFPPLLLINIPLGVAMIFVARNRIREMKEEDEDDYRKY